MTSQEVVDIIDQYAKDNNPTIGGFSFKYIKDKPKEKWHKLPK